METIVFAYIRAAIEDRYKIPADRVSIIELSERYEFSFSVLDREFHVTERKISPLRKTTFTRIDLYTTFVSFHCRLNKSDVLEFTEYYSDWANVGRKIE